MPFPWLPAVPGYDVELPGAYVDALFEQSYALLPDTVLINRSPEPGDVDVPGDTLIEFDITQPGLYGTAFVPGSIYVTVNGVLAFAAGVFQPGFNGPASAVAVTDPRTLRMVIDYVGTFSSLSTVTVSVANSTSTFTEAYAFTIVDATAPTLTAAVAQTQSRVRLLFDEVLDPATGLTPANYTIQRTQAPSVATRVVSVALVDDSTVDISTEIPLTEGAIYLVRATGVFDAYGNVVVSPANQVTFSAFALPRPAGRSFDLYSMLPTINRQEDSTQDLARFIACLQEVSDLLLYDVDRFVEILDPDTASEAWLDLMLADLGNPFAFDLDETDKRRLLRVLVDMYRLKGTIPGITQVVLFFLGLSITIDAFNTTATGWLLGESDLGDASLWPGTVADLYSFQVVSPVVLTDTQRDQLREIVEYMKPAHTHLVAIVEPSAPPALPDHVELGLSELDTEWELHL